MGERRNSGECRLFWILVHRGPRRCVGPRGISARASPSRQRTRGAAERRTHSSRIGCTGMRPGRASRWRSCARRRIRPNPRREPERAVGHGHHRVRDPGGQGVPAAGHRPLRRHARRLNVRAIVANDHSDNEVQQNVTAPSRYVAHLRIGNAVRDLNLVPHGISVSGWSKSHNRSFRRIGSADGPLTSTPYLAADGVRSLG